MKEHVRLFREEINTIKSMKIEQRLLTIDEAATLLGVSQGTLRNWEKEGMFSTIRTENGHRRYTEEQINKIRKARMGEQEIIIPNVTPARMIETLTQFLSTFNKDEKATIIIGIDQVDRKVRITVDSEDGLTTARKTFKMED